MGLRHLAATGWRVGGILLLVTSGATGAAPVGEVSPGLEEIVVTATRRAERLEDVPISVTAFTQERMDQQGLRSIDDITRLTPGITLQRNGTSQNYNDEGSDINIRGIDSTAGTSTTGVYINDTPIQSRHLGFGSVNAFPTLFDLERVEVLRGPQGTSFGAGAEGGVIRFITPSPDLKKYGGSVRSEVASTRNGALSYELSAAGGGPIIDDVLGFRVSASFRRDGGWVDRVAYMRATTDPTDGLTPPVYSRDVSTHSNWQQITSVHADVKWAITDAFSITPSVYYQRLELNDTGVYWPNLSDPRSAVYRNGNRLANPSHDPFWLAAIRADWNLDFAQLTSNTSYFARDLHSVSDYTQYLRISYLNNPYPSAPLDASYSPFQDKQSNFYQELRLSSTEPHARLLWSTGFFYSRMYENVRQSISDMTLDAQYAALHNGATLCVDTLGYPCPNGDMLNAPLNKVVDKQIALYGEVTWKFARTVGLTAGLRVSKVDYVGSSQAGGALQGGAPVSSYAANSEKPVTPKAVLTWQPNPGNLVYLGATKGYRVGGTNVDAGTLCNADLQTIGVPVGAGGNYHVPNAYKSDNLWSYELGSKNSLFNHRLQFNSSLFWIDWREIQQNVYLPTCGQQFVGNLGRAVSRGGEIDASLRPLDALTLNITVGYVDAKYTKYSCAGVLVFNGTNCSTGGTAGFAPVVSAGDRLPSAPWSFIAAAQYVFPAWKEAAPYLRADFQFLTAQTAILPGQDLRNGLTDSTIPGLPIEKNLNMRGGMRFDGLDVSLFANNLTDAHPALFTSRDLAVAADQQYFARGVRPRTIGITATYRY